MAVIYWSAPQSSMYLFMPALPLGNSRALLSPSHLGHGRAKLLELQLGNLGWFRKPGFSKSILMLSAFSHLSPPVKRIRVP